MSIYNNSDASAKVLNAGARELVNQARNLGLTWTLRLATVVNSAPDSMTAIYDGDSAAISMVNMSGNTLSPDERVYALIIPPSGNFVVGRVNNFGLVARVDSAVYNNSSAAAEIAILTLPSTTYANGGVYEFKFRINTETNGPASNKTICRIRQGTGVLGTIVNNSNFYNNLGAGVETRTDSCYVGFDGALTDTFTLTQIASLSTGTSATAANTDVFYFEAYRVGSLDDYPSAFVI